MRRARGPGPAGGPTACGYVDRVDQPPEPPEPLVAPWLTDAVAGGLDGRLERWAADVRVDEAARSRSRERWLRRQAEEETSVAGVLADLRDAGTAVAVRTQGGSYQGIVRAVGADCVALTPVAGGPSEVVVALDALDSVRTRPGAAQVVGDRRATPGSCLADVIVELADERATVQVVTRSGDVVAGEVASAGRDVVTLRTAARPPAVTYVPLAAVSEVIVAR
jgi:hypothetical protein